MKINRNDVEKYIKAKEKKNKKGCGMVEESKDTTVQKKKIFSLFTPSEEKVLKTSKDVKDRFNILKAKKRARSKKLARRSFMDQLLLSNRTRKFSKILNLIGTPS